VESWYTQRTEAVCLSISSPLISVLSGGPMRLPYRPLRANQLLSHLRVISLMDRPMWAILALIALVSGQSAITVAPTNSNPTIYDAFAIQVGFQRPNAPPRAFANLLPLSTQAWETLPVAVDSTFLHTSIADRHVTRTRVNQVML